MFVLDIVYACPLSLLVFKTKNIMCPSQNEHNKDAANNILIREIESWSNFEYALREENRLLFNKMLSECKDNEDLVRAANSKDEFFQPSHCLWH
jgi:hypothetical protein